MTDDHSHDGEFLKYVTSPAFRSRSSSHEAGHAVLAHHFGHKVVDVSIEARIVPEGSPDAKSISGGQLGATGGHTQIDWTKVSIKAPNFDSYLQDIATVMMGGRAAEELTHPDDVVPAHWKADVVYFHDAASQAHRTESAINHFLEEGHLQAKELLQRTDIAEQHQRVRDYLFSGRGSHPNGEFITRRVMKGLST